MSEKRDKNKPELLAPAGNFEKLKWAVEYGADAVYFGGKFSLRSFAGDFSDEVVQDCVNYLHARGKKGYVTLNCYPFSDEYDEIRKTARKYDEIGVDAFIVADLGVLFELKKLNLNAAIHISTQANTLSLQTVRAYQELGAARVNLARELSLEQIQSIQAALAGSGIETEVFVHGAVCFSYSGRCAISDYLTGRRANRGECTHPCRWKYSVVEEERPGEYHPVFEDERGLYLFNSKDLALFEYIPELMRAGVDSFKVEGRMKSIHYIGSVVSLYRQIIDGKALSKERIEELLARVKNRGYSTGFIKGSVTPDDYQLGDNHSGSSATFVGNVLGENEIYNGSRLFRVRNKVHAGEALEVLKPDGSVEQIQLPHPLFDDAGRELEFANNEQKVAIGEQLPEFTILRRLNK
ncbi:putative protease YhbU precursor [Limihaloglobus sulfuriphilus]|uniref:Putative protease YhbU n=1 Tax=Limihaloglobus sulfuriphilus TaxID=1851148 RepID=A0A1Q2MII2_9BACT|nr:U32 family peptidase [Limihaloglobus sulfuriphilus]AQQ72469.1 putative protease YhbU precursor [Limihaloglobus sulfuriphilus]